MSAHPRQVLLGAQASAVPLPVCDHYSGVEQRMRKSMALQAQMFEEFGTCVFDVSLDCEDGAPVGGEAEHAHLVAELLLSSADHLRVAARLHPVNDDEGRLFAQDVAIVAGRAGHKLSHLMVPKVECVADVDKAVEVIDACCLASLSDNTKRMPIHVLVESSHAIHKVFEIAAHPRVQSISFGVMDFVSSHGGAISSEGMGVSGQFTHPLVRRAKLEIAAACHAFGKTPSHCVVPEFKDSAALEAAARRAVQEFGYTRMWSIHPDQIRPVLAAMSPLEAEIVKAARIIQAAIDADWAPIAFEGQLHDRASYRYFWQLLERAHQTGCSVPSAMQSLLDAP